MAARNSVKFGNSVGDKAAIVLCIYAEASFWSGQRLLGDRAKDGPNAAFEMEMDRGRTDAAIREKVEAATEG